MYLFKTIMKYIFKCKINEKQVFINKKQVILMFIKSMFEMQLYTRSKRKK
jgi:hypothetical protein